MFLRILLALLLTCSIAHSSSPQFCPQGSFLMWNDTCSSSCPSPLVQETQNNASFCSYPCNTNEYLYANGSCLDSCIFHPTNENGYLFCRFQCQDFIYQNDTCLLTCTDPYVQGNSIDGKTCTSHCPVGQYLFDNGTCITQCPTPYVSKWPEPLIRICSSPCNSSQFLYQNGSCLPTCPFPYISESDGGANNLCNPPCPVGEFFWSQNEPCKKKCDIEFQQIISDIPFCAGGHICWIVTYFNSGTSTSTTTCTEPTGTCPPEHFLFEDGTCNRICPDKFTPEFTNTTCSSPCGLHSALYPNGSCLASSCTGNFMTRTQGNFTFCDPKPCNENEYLYANGSCSNSCIYTSTIKNEYLYCRLECEDYIYQNNTCLPTCLDNFIEANTTDNNGKTCTFVCTTGQYLFDNGTCSQCPVPYFSKIESESRFCFNPCDSGEYLYRNGSCLPTCTEEGFVLEYQSEIKDSLCTNLCSSGQYLYVNGSCLSTCRSDFIAKVYGGEMFCHFPCKSDEVLYPNGTCAMNCTGDFVSQYQGDYRFCIGKNGCQSPLDYKYQNGTCSSSCPAPYIDGASVGNLRDGRRCFLPCLSGEYLFANGTCSEQCLEPYLSISETSFLYCSSPCDSSQFLYQNGSCLPTCPFPHISGPVDCNPPCPVGEYYWGYSGPCVKKCLPGYEVLTDDILYCQGRWECMYPYFFDENEENCLFPCPVGQYLYENGSCLSTCRSDFALIGPGLQCIFPCRDGEYLYPPTGKCKRSCPGDYVPESQFCVKCLDYKYSNGTCSPSCPASFLSGKSTSGKGKTCTFPCPTGQYLFDNGTCSLQCPASYLTTIEPGARFCSVPCSSDHYLYRNGSCLPTCQSGYVREYSSPRTRCTYPCKSGQYLYANGSCLATCRSDFIKQINGASDLLCDFPCNFDEYLYPNGTCAMNCTGDFLPQSQTGYTFCELNQCPIGFLYQNGSCQESCPSPYISVLDAGATKLCNLPCPLGQYYYSPNGTCASGCEIQFRTVKNDILSCDGGVYNYTETPSTNESSYTAILEIYIRYNIALNDFYNQNGLIKFLKLLAELFGIDISQITISDIREGSTIIETKVSVTSDPDSKSKASTNSQIKTMSEKFENAAKAKNLNLAGIKVLNYRSSIVIPDQGKIRVKESSSSAVAIGVGIGVGLAVLAVGIIVYSVYRRKKIHKMTRVAKIAAFQVKVNPTADQQPKRDQEEFYGLALNSIIQIKEKTENRIEPFGSESHQPGPVEKIEEETFKSNGYQEVQDQKAMSLNQIMNRIEAEANAENPIELNFEN